MPFSMMMETFEFPHIHTDTKNAMRLVCYELWSIYLLTCDCHGRPGKRSPVMTKAMAMGALSLPLSEAKRSHHL